MRNRLVLLLLLFSNLSFSMPVGDVDTKVMVVSWDSKKAKIQIGKTQIIIPRAVLPRKIQSQQFIKLALSQDQLMIFRALVRTAKSKKGN